MSTSKNINRICAVITAFLLVITVLFMSGSSWGLQSVQAAMGYETRLFDTSSVHTIDIVMNDWDTFIENCESEEYSACTVVIDGEKYSNIGIRAKGNTSLSSVRQKGSQRYSFKLEFDQYTNGKSYYGLDKLCLNNLIQDNSMMKDYLAYQLMADFGADAPLCSFVYITVNGEDWGLYLAVEGLEDSFLQRSYGSNAGDLYKPDSMSFGGGRGNGRDFDIEKFRTSDEEEESEDAETSKGTADTNAATDSAGTPDAAGTEQSGSGFPGGDMSNSGFPGGGMPDGMPEGGFPGGDMSNSGFPGGGMPDGMPEGGFPGGDMSEGGFPGGGMPDGMPEGGFSGGDMSDSGFPDGGMPDGGMTSSEGATDQAASASTAETAQAGGMPTGESGNSGRSSRGGGGGFNFGGMGSDDVKLKYIDDDPDSYSNIFNNAKTETSTSDKKRLIASLKSLNEYTDLENILDMDEVLRYFVVHNFVCNGDSYTGAMIHNYYLHESDGKLGMIPWDYNLAFGTFQGGNASESVNASIDSPVNGGDVDDRPMVGWIFSDESYTEAYHELFSEFIDRWFSNGELAAMIEETADMIRSYVEKDPSKFCTTEEFEAGVDVLSEFVTLRGEAVSRQLQGDDTPVDTGDLNLSDMGSMGGGGGGGGFGGFSQGGGFDITSMIKVTDAEGNEVALSDLVEDVSALASLQLSDGTSVDISGTDFRALMQTDFTKVVSVTDQNGNVTDLSEYTISVNFPSRSGGGRSGRMNGNTGDSTGTAESMESKESTGSKESAESAGSAGSIVSPPGDAPQQAQNQTQAPDQTQGTSKEQTEGTDTNNAAAPEGTQSSGDTQTSEGTQTSDGSQTPEGTQGFAAPNGGGGGFQPPGGMSGGMPSGMPGGMPGSQQGSFSNNTAALVGASFLVLAVGLLIAVKKKKTI